MPNSDLLENKAVIVTGGGSGIGRATCIRLAAYGANVAVVDINGDDAAMTADMIHDTGGMAISVPADVSSADQIQAMIAKTVAEFGQLDGAFNGAGVAGKIRPIGEDDEANFDRIIAVNLKGTWMCTKYEVEQMVRQGKGGSIVNCSSTLGLGGLAGNQAIYSASKHGIIGITKSVAIEYGKDQIRVNVVCPGAIKTPMLDSVFGNSHYTPEMLDALHPLGRCGEPGELGGAIAMLLSDEGSFITGAVLPVDGGITAS